MYYILYTILYAIYYILYCILYTIYYTIYYIHTICYIRYTVYYILYYILYTVYYTIYYILTILYAHLYAGFTAVALETIKHECIWFAAGGQLQRVGCASGAGPEIVQRCLKRMIAWTSLAVLVVDTEYPDFEITAAFHVFTELSGTMDMSDLLQDCPPPPPPSFDSLLIPVCEQSTHTSEHASRN